VTDVSSAMALPSYLVDALPKVRLRDTALVAAGAVLTGVAAQVAVPLPFTPVPLTLQTFAVLLVGAAMGPWRGLASMGLYVVAGAAGIPWFAGGASGAGSASFGYAVGFIAAAGIVGRFSAGARTRSPWKTVMLLLMGNLVIYAVGVPWVALATGMPLGRAVSLGLVPFVIGDLVKMAAAGILLPGAWRLANHAGR
jgi:biotin transport system substrate-specific component